MRRRSRLRRRYGRSLGPQAITRPAGGGKVDVILVDSKGRQLRTIKRGVTYASAVRIIQGEGL